MRSPQAMAHDMEGQDAPPSSTWEWFRGYGVMGLSFSSGHVLGFRRMTSSSLGPPFTSVWHREPSGAWTMFVNEDPDVSCPRYFGAAVQQVAEVDIDLIWEGGDRLVVTVPEARLQWALHLSADLTTRSLSWVAGAFPLWLARRKRVLDMAGKLGGKLLDSGELRLRGNAPNRYRFVAIPRAIWRIEAAAAVVEGTDLGPLGALREQARLGDFLIPNRGLFFRGEVGFQAHPLDDGPAGGARGWAPEEETLVDPGERPGGPAAEEEKAAGQLREERIS